MTEETDFHTKLMNLRIESPKSLSSLIKVFLDDIEIVGILDIDFKLGAENRGIVEIKMVCDNVLINVCPETLHFIQKLKSIKPSTIYDEQKVDFVVTDNTKQLDAMLQKLDELKRNIEGLEEWHQKTRNRIRT